MISLLIAIKRKGAMGYVPRLFHGYWHANVWSWAVVVFWWTCYTTYLWLFPKVMTNMCVCTCVHACMCMCVHVCVHTCVYLCVHVVSVAMCVYVNVCNPLRVVLTILPTEHRKKYKLGDWAHGIWDPWLIMNLKVAIEIARDDSGCSRMI